MIVTILCLTIPKVFEESTFGKYNIDVLWMFIWTLYTQVTLGWITWPVQSVDAFGGIDVHNIPSIFVDGCKCTVGIATPGRPYCDWRNSVLFFVYCTIDYSYYAIGLYVIQTRGASLMILATAIVPWVYSFWSLLTQWLRMPMCVFEL
eukprot:m.675915 g.675915  ORF g.675915 m.675915 type:complete len:148 (-) comp22788_c1_seq73:1384-1827(-)